MAGITEDKGADQWAGYVHKTYPKTVAPVLTNGGSAEVQPDPSSGNFPLIPPEVPNLSGSIGDGQNMISWGSVDPHSYIVTLKLHWATNEAQLKAGVDSVIENVVSPYTHTGLSNGTPYFYTLEVDYGDEKIYSPSLSDSIPSYTPVSPVYDPGLVDVPPAPPVADKFAGWAFSLGFDNISAGISNFEDNSIYVSAPLTCSSSNIIGLKVRESRPYFNLAVDPNNILYTEDTYDHALDPTGLFAFNGSIEYWIVKDDYKKDAKLPFNTSRFPILPLGVSRINHERIILSEASKTQGMFQFFATVAASNIEVWANGITANPAGYSFVQVTAEKTPNQGPGNRMRLGIMVTNTNYIKPTDIITVSYDPLVSSGLVLPPTSGTYSPYGTAAIPNVVDLVGDLSVRHTLDNLVAIDAIGNAMDATTSKLYLVILLRRNSYIPSISPSVEEYTLFVNSNLTSQFEGKI